MALREIWEPLFNRVRNASVQCASWFAQKRAIGRVLHESMLEEICGVRRRSLARQEARLKELVQQRCQFRLRLARDGV